MASTHMNQSYPLAYQLQHLLTVLSQQGTTHLTEIETDLSQTGELLVEAIEKLGKSFIGIHDCLAIQHALINTIADGEILTQAVRDELARLQQQTASHISAAVTSLQFQDLTSQLIGRMAGHAGTLRHEFDSIGITSAAMSIRADDAALMMILVELNRILDKESVVLEKLAPKTVAQTHMESGDIELF